MTGWVGRALSIKVRAGPVDKSAGFRWGGLAQGQLIKVRGLEDRTGPLRLLIKVKRFGEQAGPGPLDKGEGSGGLGWARAGQ